MIARKVVGFLCFLGLVTSTTVVAAGDTSLIRAGRVLAKGWCAHCHVVSADQRVAPAAGVPTFIAVANDPATTEISLRVFLATPHTRMPNFILTRQETDKIIAYILSLRTD
jgi:mono/diheme cytochrome c family protein